MWEGRYKASAIQRENYLLSCCRYVELNPIRAVMVQKVEDYPWSSYSERIGKKPNDLLDEDGVYLGLGQTRSERISRYQEFLESGISVTEQKFLAESFQRNQLTGDGRFVDEIERRVGIRVERRGPGRPRRENDEK